MESFESRQQDLIKEQDKRKEEIKHCKKCGATLDTDDKFCPECGEKIDGEERCCRWCGHLTTKEICPECGKRVIPQICNNCSKDTYFDICEHCGTILNPILQNFAVKENIVVKKMSKQDAQAILREFEESETAELQHFRDKMNEHEILLAEKKFFEEREKRINETFGGNPNAIKYPDPEETMFLQKAAEGIKKAALRKEKENIQETLEKIFPGYKTLEEEHEELLRLMREREELFNQNIASSNEKLTAEIAAAQEKRRKELEELQKKIEEQRKRDEAIAREKKRLEIEAFNKRICGNYIYHDTTGFGEEIKLSFSIDESGTLIGKEISTWSKNRSDKYRGVIYASQFKGTFDGTNIRFEEYQMEYLSNPQYLNLDDILHKFAGTINSDGTVIHGYWFSNDHANSYFDYRKY